MDAKYFSTTGKRVKLLRAYLELDQGELAERVQIRQSYLSQIENDKANPSGEVIAKLAAALNTTADFLLLLSSDLDKPAPPLQEPEAVYA